MSKAEPLPQGGALALSTAQKGALLQAGLQLFKNSALTVAVTCPVT